MTWNRRHFIAASTFGLVSALGVAALFAGRRRSRRRSARRAEVRGRAPQRRRLHRPRRDHRLPLTPDAVMVVDSQFADTAQMFLDGLKPKTSRKIDC